MARGSKSKSEVSFLYHYNGRIMRMQYKKVEDFLEEPLRKSGYFGWDTEIQKVRVKKAKGCSQIKTVKELYDFVSNYDFSAPINPEFNADPKFLADKHADEYERKEIYSIEQIQQATKDVLFSPKEEADIVLDGDTVRGCSQRYQLFFTKGVKCCCCGIEGKFFRKERIRKMNTKRYHLNLYAINDDGIEVLMTKDHIIPASKGGENKLCNYQTMCEICNKKKGNQMEV